jgi:hypothetical protein
MILGNEAEVKRKKNPKTKNFFSTEPSHSLGAPNACPAVCEALLRGRKRIGSKKGKTHHSQFSFILVRFLPLDCALRAPLGAGSL